MQPTSPTLLSWDQFYTTQIYNYDFLKVFTPLPNFGHIRYKENTFDWVDFNDGAIYRNCSARRTMLFFLETILTRPVETVCRFGFNAFFPFSIPYEMTRAICRETIRRKKYAILEPRSRLYLAARAVARIFADFLRIPYYGALLTIYAVQATFTYFKERNNSEKQFEKMMEWRILIVQTERTMVWQDRGKCYLKFLQQVDLIHRVARRAPENCPKPLSEGIDQLSRERNLQYNWEKSLQPWTLFLLKIPNFFSSSSV